MIFINSMNISRLNWEVFQTRETTLEWCRHKNCCHLLFSASIAFSHVDLMIRMSILRVDFVARKWKLIENLNRQLQKTLIFAMSKLVHYSTNCWAHDFSYNQIRNGCHSICEIEDESFSGNFKRLKSVSP